MFSLTDVTSLLASLIWERRVHGRQTTWSQGMIFTRSSAHPMDERHAWHVNTLPVAVGFAGSVSTGAGGMGMARP